MTVHECLSDQRGIALVMALILLLSLTGLVLAALSMSAFEPQISQNLVDTVNARMLADSGLDYGYNLLVNTANWSTVLAAATGASCNAGGLGVLLGAANTPLPGLTATNGTFTLRVRNDCQPSDNTMTGVTVENAANFATDTNKRLILEATGTKNSASRTLSVVIQNLNLSWNTALGFPGVQADVNFSGSAFTIDGRDTKMTDTIGSPTGSNPVVFGITTSVAGNTASIQTALANNQQNDVWGQNPSGSGTVHGDSAVTTDTTTLTSQSVTNLVNQLKAMADITINSSSSNPYSITGMGGTCASNWADSTCWGTDAKPKIVYVNATLSDQNQEYTSLSISGGSGTGILIVQNGHVNITGDFNWHGPIIVTGNNVGMVYRGGGSNGIYGAVVVNELRNDGATNLEGDIRGNAKIAYSKDALDLVTSALSRKLIQMTAWREK